VDSPILPVTEASLKQHLEALSKMGVSFRKTTQGLGPEYRGIPKRARVFRFTTVTHKDLLAAFRKRQPKTNHA
jgi:hypothetical protein